MVIDKGFRLERAARGMFVGAFALACNACGGGHGDHGSSGGRANAGGAASRGGSANSGGAKSSGGRVGGGGAVAAGGAVSDGGVSSEGGAISDGGVPSDGGTSGQGGSGAVVGMGGDAGADSGGTGSGGMNAAGGANAGGMDVAGGTSAGGTSAGGMDAAGGINSGGTSAGGMDAAGGVNSGGTSAGGMDAAGGASAGGTNFGGANSGGTSAGGTSAGGMNAAGGMNSGGAPASCGNAMLEAPEECDDGNTQSLDGCNAGCRYEVVDRMTSISVQGVSAPSFCSPTTNALGRAFSSTALEQINTQLQQSISDGVLNNLVQFSGLEDLTGASDDSSLAIGFLPAAPDLANGAWPGGAPLDFWFRVPSTSVDAQRAPLNSLSGSVASRALSAGPGLLKLPLAIGGAPSTLSVSSARLRATLAETPAPNVPAPPPTNLAPGLTVFQSIRGTGSGQGICGNVTVESLAHIPVPASLTSGTSACLACTGSRTYTACSGSSVEPGCNSMLDVLVGGCKALFCLVTVVTPAQPDVPAPGSASVRPLSLGSGNAVPNDQISNNQDAYSSYFKFDANRAHITGLR